MLGQGGCSAASASVGRLRQGTLSALPASQPYGNLAEQAVQRFECYEDLAAHKVGGMRWVQQRVTARGAVPMVGLGW